MFLSIRVLFMLSCILFLLTACGGGGGGSTGNMGGPASGPTAAQVRETLADIGFEADRLLMTGIVTTSRSRILPGERTYTSCSGLRCLHEFQDWELSYYRDDFTVPANARIRVDQIREGVQMGEISGRQAGQGYHIDYTVLGGWLDDSFFGVSIGRAGGRVEGVSLDGFEALYAFSLGDASGSNPMSGSATWRGLMVGRDDANPTATVTGRTELIYNFGNNTLDVNMTNIRGPRTYADMTWDDLAVQDGRFSGGAGSNSLSGTFYGDTHNEVGGVFERNAIVGAFGATRQ